MGLFDWLFSRSSAGTANPDIQAGIDRLIQRIDPRLKALASAPARLAPAVERALEFCHATLATLPPPQDAAPGHWRESPLLRALFTRDDEVQQIISRQPAVQEYARQHPGEPVFYAILGAVLRERQGFGLALNGDALQHDVAIITLNFERHRVYLPRSSAAALDQDLRWALFDQLGLEILARLSAMKEDQADLQEEIALLRTQLAHLEHQGIGDMFSEEGGAPQGEEGAQLASLAERLRERQEALNQSRQRLLTLDDTLAWIAATLMEPEGLVEVDGLDYRINSFNQRVGPDQPGEDVHFRHFRFHAPHPRQGVVLRLRYPLADLLPRSALTREIERLYG
ncbi:hypothetical protein [Azovibrio restrictus]|uniref:hypothetical protein n=1 Tax=Azovibrio restrictus TaxID=146938 RepID=UPI0026F258D8|nr:hypothetical protein [Azovibrio restrictus]